jgi:bifunctional NMN adenylyltransferase/nudix hydrolase
MNLGLFIWRLNPPHIWHIWIIKRALKENNKVLVLLWTPLSKDQNNPFDFKQREALLDLSFKNENNLKILELKDNKSDLIWIENLKEIISSNYREINNINLYCW